MAIEALLDEGLPFFPSRRSEPRVQPGGKPRVPGSEAQRSDGAAVLSLPRISGRHGSEGFLLGSSLNL